MSEDMRTRFGSVVSELIDRDERTAVVLADISAGLFDRVARRHPQRVVNLGIREQLMIGVAGGLALEGMRPFVHSYAPFLTQRPYEQIKLDLVHQGVGAVLVSVGASSDAAPFGRTHLAPEDVALINTLPDWRVHVPGHADEAELHLRAAAEADDARYIRLAADTNAAPVLTDGDAAAVVRRGSAKAPVVIAVGPTLDRTLEATEQLDVTVLYAATVRPFDTDALLGVMASPDVVVVEPLLAGTLAGELAPVAATKPMRIRSIGVPRAELRAYGDRSEHDAANGLDARSINAAISSWLN